MVLAEEVVMLMVILTGHATTEVFSDVEKDGNKNYSSHKLLRVVWAQNILTRSCLYDTGLTFIQE